MICKNTIHILFLFVIITHIRYANAERLDLTDQVEYIGNPYLERYPADSQIYARNIWDMVSFNGKLYLGAGNSSNAGPAPNAGPVPIISYDPETDSFSTDFLVDEEQIDGFYVLEGKLYVPGHDPRENWRLGNFYSLSSGGIWEKHRTIPGAIHTFSLTVFDNKLFAALGTQNKKSVVVSKDHGLSWQQYEMGSAKVFDFLRVKNRLYAAGVFFSQAILEAMANGQFPNPVSCHEYTGWEGFRPRLDLSAVNIFFPEALPRANITYKISKRLFWDDKTIFIGSEIHNDHQSLPFGLFVATSLELDKISIDNIRLPPSSRPWDILAEGERVFVLLEHLDTNPKEISVIVSEGEDLKTWKELCYWHMSTFARSFAVLNNSFYFSGGGEVENPWKWQQNEISPDTGKIYKVAIP